MKENKRERKGKVLRVHPPNSSSDKGRCVSSFDLVDGAAAAARGRVELTGRSAPSWKASRLGVVAPRASPKQKFIPFYPAVRLIFPHQSRVESSDDAGAETPTTEVRDKVGDRVYFGSGAFVRGCLTLCGRWIRRMLLFLFFFFFERSIDFWSARRFLPGLREMSGKAG